MSAVNAELLTPGFDDPVDGAQRTFRAVLAAMACPGSVHAVPMQPAPVAPLHPATWAVALTLLDGETPVWLDGATDRPRVRDNLRFHCGCPLVEKAGAAAFGLIAGPAVMPALAAFRCGDDLYPDRSATLILQVNALSGGQRLLLSGPGIETQTELMVAGLPENFVEQWTANGALYPAGIDLILTNGERVAALPRTTRVEAG